MNIRLATPTDSAILSGLCIDVQSLHAQHHPHIFKMPENDGEALGYVLCKLIERPENPFTYAMRYLLIDQISVRPAARGQGVGVALMKEAEMLAEKLRLQRIQLDSWDFNLNAHAFFEHLGFQKFNFRFWRTL